MKEISTTAVAMFTMAMVVACGGGSTAPRPASVPARSGGSADLSTAEGLCGLLTPEDWQQFNYVTAAQPEVSSDGAGTAICTWANGLTVEIYTHADTSEAEATLDTILENVPMDDPQPYFVPGAAQSLFDSDLGDGGAGLAAQAGRLTLFVSALSRDAAQVELATLAGLVLARGASLI